MQSDRQEQEVRLCANVQITDSLNPRPRTCRLLAAPFFLTVDAVPQILCQLLSTKNAHAAYTQVEKGFKDVQSSTPPEPKPVGRYLEEHGFLDLHMQATVISKAFNATR